MDFINLLSSAWPANNVWATLIKLFDVGSYAWTIILFTVVLKLVMSPLDFLQRYYTNKTSRAQAKLQPQIAKLQKQYGQNQNLLMQKQNELYQKSGFSMKGSCIVMLVYMVLTLTIFITLFNSMQFIAGFKIKNQFQTLNDVYSQSEEVNQYYDYLGYNETAYNEFKAIEGNEQKSVEDFIIVLEDTKKTANEEEYLQKRNTLLGVAQENVKKKYEEIKDSWLWIKNIWIADKPTTHEILTYNQYTGLTGDYSISQKHYNEVMEKLLNGGNEVNGVNGYYILSVLVLGISFFSQWLSKKLVEPKDKNGKHIKQPMSTKIMMIILPFTMLIFTLNSSAVFALYIMINSLMSTILTPIITLLCNKIEDKKEQKHEEEVRVDYRRY